MFWLRREKITNKKHKSTGFGAREEDVENAYFLFVRSLLEQSATVWHSSLTEEISEDLERVQKSAVKSMLGANYVDYKSGLTKLDMAALKENLLAFGERINT